MLLPKESGNEIFWLQTFEELEILDASEIRSETQCKGRHHARKMI